LGKGEKGFKETISRAIQDNITMLGMQLTKPFSRKTAFLDFFLK